MSMWAGRRVGYSCHRVFPGSYLLVVSIVLIVAQREVPVQGFGRRGGGCGSLFGWSFLETVCKRGVIDHVVYYYCCTLLKHLRDVAIATAVKYEDFFVSCGFIRPTLTGSVVCFGVVRLCAQKTTV